MFKRILVAYDGSEGARAALALGIELARTGDAELSSVSVEEHLPRYAATISEVQGAKEQIDAHFRTLTKEARDAAALAGVELEALVRQGHEVQEILRAAREGKVALLILGAHGHSRVFQRVVGSTSLSVMRQAPCSVLIVRGRAVTGDGLGRIERIVVGLDGSPLGRVAFRTALDFSILCGASLLGVTVHEASPLARREAPGDARAEPLGRAAEEHAGSAAVRFEHVVRAGHAAQALREQARESQADLLVIGATGLEHPWSPSIGGTAATVAAEAPCSVLLVRPPQAALHVSDIMVRAVVSVPGDAPLADVVGRLVRGEVKALPVIDARRHVVGIVTGGDLLRRGDLELRLSIKRELDRDTLHERLRALSASAKRARDVMTRHVHTIDAEADLATAISRMAALGVKRLPVVDEDGALIGIVTRADLLRAIAALPEPAHGADHVPPTVARTVADAATTEVPLVRPDAPADEVFARVLASPLRRVVVTQPDGTVLGLISDRDLLARSAPDTRSWIVRLLRGHPAPGPRGEAPERPLTASAFMAPLLITVRADDSLVHAIRLMMQHQVKRLIVVDDDGRFRGLIDRREILRVLASQSPA
jgi:nucleotide-binding universal stress UspA family protein/CBS-domain-containing membrane protein